MSTAQHVFASVQGFVGGRDASLSFRVRLLHLVPSPSSTRFFEQKLTELTFNPVKDRVKLARTNKSLQS
jgi:hypothetical protein